MSRQRTDCEGFHRRDFLRAGVAGLLGISLPDALRADARGAVLMVLGTAPWLVCAGLTEGFVTPRGLPLGAALAVGAAWFVLFWSLVLTRGRRGQAAGSSTAG